MVPARAHRPRDDVFAGRLFRESFRGDDPQILLLLLGKVLQDPLDPAEMVDVAVGE